MAGKMKTTTATPPPSVKAFNCLSCGSTLSIRAEGMSQVIACSSCKSVMDISSEMKYVLSSSKNKRLRNMVIPLGTRGKIHGTLWEVIGYMERSDEGSYNWSEYLLFNPMKGFRWLSENNGHWAYVLMTKEKPKADTGFGYGMATYSGHHYQLFHKGVAKIIYIEGEFYWRAKVGDKVSVMDFVREDELLSMEKSDDETVWSVSEYLPQDSVKRGFKLKELPPVQGVAPNQPSPFSEKVKGIGKAWVFFLLALFALQFLHVVTSKNKLIHRELYTFNLVHIPGMKSTIPFAVDDQTANLQIVLYAPVDNSWLYVQGELVNLDTGETEDFDAGVEYYSGYDGEHWSEGSRFGRKNIPSVRGGNYQLNFEVTGDKFPLDYEISVYRDVPLWKPFLWALFFLCLWPLILLWRKRSFEVQRWSDSDYSPYNQYDEE